MAEQIAVLVLATVVTLGATVCIVGAGIAKHMQMKTHIEVRAGLRRFMAENHEEIFGKPEDGCD